VEDLFQAEVAALETWVATQGVPIKKPAVEKVRKPLAGVAALVDVWWQEVWHEVQSQVALTSQWRGWVAACVLPLMSGQEQRARTRCPRRKATRFEALKTVEEAMETPPLPHQLVPEVLLGWKAWAAEHARGLQRASAAVEGRNGALSQGHHTQRGLPTRRDKVWTVLHNFDCRAADGSTSNLEPASLPATTKLVSLETELATLPPSARIFCLASSRERVSSPPVNTTVFPTSGDALFAVIFSGVTVTYFKRCLSNTLCSGCFIHTVSDSATIVPIP
jgi:hypothetical protein